jgi:hypothetical protein
VIALAVVGFLVGRGSGGENGGSTTRPSGPGTASAGKVTLDIPSGWRKVAAAPSIPGLRLNDSVTLSPQGTSAAGMLAGTASSTRPSFVPDSFQKVISSSDLSDRTVVRLGKLEAFRYAGLTPKGYDGSVTLFVVPQDKKPTTVVACFAETGTAGAGGGVLSNCSAATAAMSIDGAKPYELKLSPSYAKVVNSAIGSVNSARASGVRKMKSATSAGAQAAAARSIASAYQSAANRVKKQTSTTYVQPVDDRLITTLKQAGSAYTALASAASAGSPSRYNNARKQVSSRESAVRKAVATLGDYGFTVG